jgi:magnesium transporter
MIVDCAHYQDGRRQQQGALPLEEAAVRCRDGGFVWLGMFEPSMDELARVRDAFGLHVLAVEDAQTFHLRPKIEAYDGDIRLVILRTARYDEEAEEVEFGEISIFVGPTFVITVRQGSAAELRGARERLEQRPELLDVGSASALWAVLDQVVDGYGPVVAALESDIEQVESTVFSGAAAPTERIYQLRREATDFYRAVHPLLSVVTAVEREAGTGPLRPYVRDVHDHLALVNEEVAAQRDLLTTVLEANIAVISMEQNRISVRQSATMEQLTILATVFLPLTFVTGFFGQNFDWLVTHVQSETAFVVYGLGGLLLPCVGLYSWLRRHPRAAPPALTPAGRPTGRSRPDHRRPADGRAWADRGLPRSATPS